MKQRHCHLLGIIIAATITFTTLAQTVEMPDPNLRRTVRQALNIPDTRVITRQDMARLTRLDVSVLGTTTLKGLEFATELQWLSCFRNPISDLTPLSGLTKLTYLDASGCRIVDISSLANLTQLVTLNLELNQIIDVRPLVELTRLDTLYLGRNLVLDVSPLDNLQLATFQYDQVCELPPLPLEPRLMARDYPNIVGAAYLVGQDPRLDLIFGGGYFKTYFRPDGIMVREMVGEMDRAIKERDAFIAANPSAVFLIGVPMRSAVIERWGQDWPYWVRDSAGNILPSGDKPDIGLVNFTHPHVQDLIVTHVLSVSKCGLFDGIVFDWWRDEGHDVLDGWVDVDAQFQARLNILRRIRAQVRPNFLITGNSNWRPLPHTGPYMNGLSMETGLPLWGGTVEEREFLLTLAEDTLTWAEQHLRHPRINAVFGEVNRLPEPLNSLDNLRWVRLLTTLSLTHADGYSTSQVAELGRFDEGHWYDFWDVSLGQPVGEKGQLYQGTDGLYIREYTNGWAVYNHSGAPQVITLPEDAQGVASGLVNVEHALANLDGEMYLRVTPKNPADVNGDGVVNILDLTLVAQAFGKDSMDGDVNGDGVVNVFDLVFVANAF